MTLVAPPPQQCASMPSPTSLPNGVAPSPPPPCSGCIKLHADIKQVWIQEIQGVHTSGRFIRFTVHTIQLQNMQQMMDKFDLIYMRLESLMNEKEKDRLIVHDQEMSESGSDDKDVPSPADSRASPNTTQGSRKRKPNKDTVHRVADDAMLSNATAVVSEMAAVSATSSAPVSTTTSSFVDNIGFLSGQMMDPLAQQQQLLQFIMQQSLAGAGTHPAPSSAPQVPAPSLSTMTASGPVVKTEQPDPQVLMEQLQQQFKEVDKGAYQVNRNYENKKNSRHDQSSMSKSPTTIMSDTTATTTTTTLRYGTTRHDTTTRSTKVRPRCRCHCRCWLFVRFETGRRRVMTSARRSFITTVLSSIQSNSELSALSSAPFFNRQNASFNVA
ncbi:hypothetical protein KIN20_005243 [Parelaphostrongylus tenuis]|uniref:Uncharacterized protein n=1 Tax=Parelaphostrongylus tenuis TaxID=148309 RepID=A0AAD5QJY5_PARTN|nr:hypothetical protein KIN20_005243 [Parelaphostrongylus tenuis]